MYEGEFVEDKKHGFGKMSWPNNSKIYEGQWENDQPHVFSF